MRLFLALVLISLTCCQLFKNRKPRPLIQFGKSTSQQIAASSKPQFEVDENGYLKGRPPIVTTKELMAKGSNYLNIMTRVKRLIRTRMDVETLKKVLLEIESFIPGALTEIGSLLPTLKGVGGSNNKLGGHIDNFEKRFYKLVYGFEQNYPSIRQSFPSIVSRKMRRLSSYNFSNSQIEMMVDDLYHLSKSIPIPASALTR